MTELQALDPAKFLSHRHNQNTELTDLKPFQRDIFLFDTYVAGTMHIADLDQVEADLKVGDTLDFIRDATNAFDQLAIEVHHPLGKIGYIPKKDNVIFARLMDAGKWLYGKISHMEKKGKWLKIDMAIFLKEM